MEYTSDRWIQFVLLNTFMFYILFTTVSVIVVVVEKSARGIIYLHCLSLRDVPGKPSPADVTAESLTLIWTHPCGLKSGESYQVRIKDIDTGGRWATYSEEFTACTATLTSLKASTKYKFKVRVINDDEEGPHGPESDVVETTSSAASTVERNDIEKDVTGKPFATDVTSESLTLIWTHPCGLKSGETYQVRMKDTDTRGKWATYSEDFTTCTATITSLKANTKYKFKVRVVNDDEEGTYGPESDVIETISSAASMLLDFCTIKEKGTPTVYTVPLTAVADGRNEKAKTRKFVVGESSAKYIKEKTIMLVGATGTGKSTLVNGIVNYVLGVSWNDPYRFSMVHLEKEEESRDEYFSYFATPGYSWMEEDPRHPAVRKGSIKYPGRTIDLPQVSQFLYMKYHERNKQRIIVLAHLAHSAKSLSQTEWITCYTLNPSGGGRLRYKLNIVDTPGFGDTRGIKRDEQLTDQIRELFSSTGEKGVSCIDAVCFLAKAPDARLTVTQTYIFHSIMSLFGKDIERNICTMITFADGQVPPVITSLKASKLPFGKHFTFNNSALFATNKGLENSSFSPFFWDMGKQSFQLFFDHLASTTTRSLRITKAVLDERQKLEVTISNLQPKIDAALSKLESSRTEMQILKQHKLDIASNKDFEYTVNEIEHREKDTPRGRHVTNCLTCNVTCHDDCVYADDRDKKDCVAMDSDGYCGECRQSSNKCHWTQHRNTRKIITYVTVTKHHTYKEKLKKYQQASGKLLTSQQLLEQMQSDIDGIEIAIEDSMKIVNDCNNRLKVIALNPNPLSMIQYLDLMIDAELKEKKPGFDGRLCELRKYKKRAEINKDFDRVKQDIKKEKRHLQAALNDPVPEPKKGKGLFGFLGLK